MTIRECSQFNWTMITEEVFDAVQIRCIKDKLIAIVIGLADQVEYL